MRDGVRLFTRVLVPKDDSQSGNVQMNGRPPGYAGEAPGV